MGAADPFLKKYTKKLIANKVRLVISGDLTVLPEELAVLCREKMKVTEVFTDKILNIAALCCMWQTSRPNDDIFRRYRCNVINFITFT